MNARIKFNTSEPQRYQSLGDGQTHLVQYRGRCAVCRSRVYSDGDNNDPRGVCGLHADATLRFNEHDLIRDVRLCYGCAQDGVRYKRALEIGRAE